MNHWVSKHAEDPEVCSACGEKVPNASGEGGLIITGRCKGAPELEGGSRIACASCMQALPFAGKYELVELDRHAGFCEVCGKFVGDGYYVVKMPGAQKNQKGRVTSLPLFGIWCVPPPSEAPHTCGQEVEALDRGVTPGEGCPGCQERKDKYGPARFAPHPGAIAPDFPWCFGTEEAAQTMIDEDPPMGSEWSYQVLPLAEGT